MKFKVISSNIRFDNPNDKEHVWKNRQPILVKIINDYSADLLGTQEGREPQIKNLAKGLKNLELVDGHREWIVKRMYPSILINPDTVEVLESGDIWLSKTPEVAGSSSFESAFPRLCTWIKARFKQVNQPFFYANCHLDHLKEDTRFEQIKVLLKEIKKANSNDLPLILSGDFNEGPNGEVRRLIKVKCPNIYDPWDKAEQGSHHKFNGKLTGALRIDWILVDHLFKCESIEFDKYSESGIYPSDHFPLKAVFKLTPIMM